MKLCQRHGPLPHPYCVDCWKDILAGNLTMTESNYLLELKKMHRRHRILFFFCRLLPVAKQAKWMSRLSGEPVACCHDLVYLWNPNK